MVSTQSGYNLIMARVLFDGQIFSIHKRGGIARLFHSVYHEYLSSRDTAQYSGTNLSLGLILSRYADSQKQRIWQPPFAIGSRGMSKIALIVNWACLWLYRYEVVHSTYYFKGYLHRRPGTKHVVTLHDMIPEDLPEFFPGGNPHFQKEAFLKNADRIVCVSNFTKSRLAYYYPELASKAIVISSGVDFPRDLDLRIERNNTILYVGKRGAYKDFNTLLRALPSILENEPRAQILAVGDQPFSESEYSLILELGLEEKVFQRELAEAELQNAYRTCMLTAVTSHIEGFGLPVIEAMANGSLVVATNIPVFREISNGAHIAFTPGDPKDLALKIKELLSNKETWDEMREVGRKTASQYSWANILNSLMQLYEEL